MIVINDLEDLFLPIPDDLLVNVSEAKDLILNLLDMFNNMFANQQDQGSCLQKAIGAAVKIFKHLGGKLIITQASDNLAFTSSNSNVFLIYILLKILLNRKKKQRLLK